MKTLLDYSIKVNDNRYCPVAASRKPAPPDQVAGTAGHPWLWNVTGSGVNTVEVAGSYSQRLALLLRNETGRRQHVDS